MSWSGWGPEITLPRIPLRPWGLFTQVVPVLDLVVGGANRTAAGAKWMSHPVYDPIIAEFDCDAPDEKVGNTSLEEVGTVAFVNFNLLDCSTVGSDLGAVDSGDTVDKASLLNYIFQSTLSEALTRAATSATVTDQLNLATDSTALSAESTAQAAFCAIEAGLAARISNLRGHIFVSLDHLCELMGSGAVFLRDGVLTSSAGHHVIADAGHEGADTIYATGALGYSITDPEWIGGEGGQFDPPRNTRTWLRENYGLIAFHPKHSVRVTIGS